MENGVVQWSKVEHGGVWWRMGVSSGVRWSMVDYGGACGVEYIKVQW